MAKLTGLSDEAVRDAPGDRRGWPAGWRRSSGQLVVGQNIGLRPRLSAPRRSTDLARSTAVDTAELARLLLTGSAGPAGLVDLAHALGIEVGEHHRALPDARAAAAVFLAL